MSHSDPRASDRRESAQDLPGEDQPVSSSAERPATRPSRFKGPIVLRGREAHRRTSDQRLLEQGGPQDFGHDDDFTRTDPWRIMRIQSEFVDGFDTLARLGPAGPSSARRACPRAPPNTTWPARSAERWAAPVTP